MAAWNVALSVHSLPWTSRAGWERVKRSLCCYFSVFRDSSLNWIPGQLPAAPRYCSGIDLAHRCIIFFQTVLFSPGEISRIISNIPFSLAYSWWKGSFESSWCCWCYKHKTPAPTLVVWACSSWVNKRCSFAFSELCEIQATACLNFWNENSHKMHQGEIYLQ